MPTDDAGKESGAASPELPALSTGFWDAFASGLMWEEPVLAVLSCTPIGSDHFLILATDESCSGQRKEERQREKHQVEGLKQEEGLPTKKQYQHGRLLVKRGNVPCRPEQLVNRLVSLLVYSKCHIKGRATPVVTDLQLLPGQWNRPRAPFVSHPLFAASSSTSGSASSRSMPKSDGSKTSKALSAASLPKRTREDTGDSLSEPNIVHSRSRPGPVAKVRRGVRMALGDLHLYSHHWEVVARISYKSDVKSFANAKGESSLFTVHLIDSQGTEVRATFFGRAVSLFYPRLRLGCVYIFSSGTLQRANRVHNPLAHEVEIKFDASAQIEEAPDDASIPLQKFNRVQLAHVQNLSPGSIVDVLAFVLEAKEPQTIISRAKNEEVLKRELTLLDSSGACISLSLFGAQALQLPQSALMNTPLVAIKGARVNDYAGQACLSSTAQMQIAFIPQQAPAADGAVSSIVSKPTKGTYGIPDDVMQSELLWWQSSGTKIAFMASAKSFSLSSVQTLAEVTAAVDQLLLEEPGTSRNFRTIASVFDIIDKKLTWLACPSCKRKVQKEHPLAATSDAYKCNKCRRAVIPELSHVRVVDLIRGYRRFTLPKRLVELTRWMLSLKFIDASGTLSCSALGEQGQMCLCFVCDFVGLPQSIMRVVDVTAEGIAMLENGGVDTRGRTFGDILRQLSFAEFELELNAKCEVYKGEKVVQIVSHFPVLLQRSRAIFADIDRVSIRQPTVVDAALRFVP